jgi:hypothetical protein
LLLVIKLLTELSKLSLEFIDSLKLRVSGFFKFADVLTEVNIFCTLLVVELLKSINLSLFVIDTLGQLSFFFLQFVMLNLQLIHLQAKLLILLKLASDQLCESFIEIVKL